MSVLKGEGKVPILFASTSISVGSLTHGAYLARPDLEGEWPTIVVVPSAWGVTGAMKDLTRRLARQGFAAICPDLFAGSRPARSAEKSDAVRATLALPAAQVRRDLDHVVRFITNPTGFWSSAEHGFGIVGFGLGGYGAAELAQAYPGSPLAIVGTDLELSMPEDPAYNEPETAASPPAFADWLERVVGPLLVIYGREDESAPIDDVLALRRAAPHGEWVLYEGVGGDFFDDDHPGFDRTAQVDAIERLSEFFGKHLPEFD